MAPSTRSSWTRCESEKRGHGVFSELSLGHQHPAGCIPFVGDVDCKAWIAAIDKVLALKPRVLVTGHGGSSTNAGADLNMTRDYLMYLRRVMADAVRDFVPFEEALAKTDWSRFSGLPAFRQRIASMPMAPIC